MSFEKHFYNAIRHDIVTTDIEEEKILDTLIHQNRDILKKLINNLKISTTPDDKDPEENTAKQLSKALKPVLTVNYEQIVSKLKEPPFSLTSEEADQFGSPISDMLMKRFYKSEQENILFYKKQRKKAVKDPYKDKFIYDLITTLQKKVSTDELKNAVHHMIYPNSDILYKTAQNMYKKEEGEFEDTAVKNIRWILRECTENSNNITTINKESTNKITQYLRFDDKQSEAFNSMLQDYCNVFTDTSKEEKATPEKKALDDKIAAEKAAKELADKKELEDKLAEEKAKAEKEALEQQQKDDAMYEYLENDTNKHILRQAFNLDESRLEKIVAWSAELEQIVAWNKQVAIARQNSNHQELFKKLKAYQASYNEITPLISYCEKLFNQNKKMTDGEIDKLIRNRFHKLNTRFFNNRYSDIIRTSAQINEAVRQLEALNQGIYLKKTKKGEEQINLRDATVSLAFAEKRQMVDVKTLPSIYGAIENGLDPFAVAKGEEASASTTNPTSAVSLTSTTDLAEPPYTKEQVTHERAGITKIPDHNNKVSETVMKNAHTVIIDKYDSSKQCYTTELFNTPRQLQPHLLFADMLANTPKFLQFFSEDMQNNPKEIEKFFKEYVTKMQNEGGNINIASLTKYLDDTKGQFHLLEKGRSIKKTTKDLATKLYEAYQQNFQNKVKNNGWGFSNPTFPHNDLIELSYRTLRTHLDNTRWDLKIPIQIQHVQSEDFLKAIVYVTEALSLQIGNKIPWENHTHFPTPKLSSSEIKAFRNHFVFSQEFGTRLKDIEPSRVMETAFVREQTKQFLAKH